MPLTVFHLDGERGLRGGERQLLYLAEWLRARGKTYRQMEDEGNLLQVVEFTCQYRKPVDYDDVVAIQVRVGERGRAAVVLEYEARRESDGQVCATGTTRGCRRCTCG